MTNSSGHRSTVPPGEQAERVGFSGYRLERTATRGSRVPCSHDNRYQGITTYDDHRFVIVCRSGMLTPGLWRRNLLSINVLGP